MTRETLQERRQRYASMDAIDRLDRMGRDLMNGVKTADCPAVTTADDERLWVALLRNVAAIYDQGYRVDEEAIPLAEDHWRGVEWLGEDAWRAKQRRMAGGGVS